MRNLGIAYSIGQGGLPKDEIKAVEWWKKAARLGNSDAMQMLKSRNETW